MDAMCCPLSEPDERAQAWNTSHPHAGKEHVCFECRDAIPKGTKHELYKVLFDGRWDSFRTCLLCVEIRDHFACNGAIVGMLWSDLQENFFPDMKAGGPCMDGLSPQAKARLFEQRLEWVFSHDEFFPCDQVLPPAWKAAREEALRKQREADDEEAKAKHRAFYEQFLRVTGQP